MVGSANPAWRASSTIVAGRSALSRCTCSSALGRRAEQLTRQHRRPVHRGARGRPRAGWTPRRAAPSSGTAIPRASVTIARARRGMRLELGIMRADGAAHIGARLHVHRRRLMNTRMAAVMSGDTNADRPRRPRPAGEAAAGTPRRPPRRSAPRAVLEPTQPVSPPAPVGGRVIGREGILRRRASLRPPWSTTPRTRRPAAPADRIAPAPRQCAPWAVGRRAHCSSMA